jgi:8-oxo-dGTP diphosphatase
VKIRGIEVEMVEVDPARAGAEGYVLDESAAGAAGYASRGPAGPVEMRVSAVGEGGIQDERTVRAALAVSLAQAGRLALASLALPAFGAGPGGPGPVAAGKIAAQEIIRFAREGQGSLRTIRLCCPDGRSFAAVEKAVTGYIAHFLDVLLWGPFVTVDALIRVPGPGIVLVKRSNPPFGYALPGGFVDYGESLEEAVRREAFEETGLELLDLRQLHTYSDPGRDPRFHTITTVFTARATGNPAAGDDAAAVHVAAEQEIASLPFAFDHRAVLEDYLGGRWG